MTTKNKMAKFISSILIIVILVPAVLFSQSKPVQAYALPVVEVAGTGLWTKITSIFSATTSSSTAVNTGLHFKDIAQEALKEIARTFAKRLLAQMTQDTVKWINSGFHGNPLFLQNPESFFKDIAKSEIKTLTSMVGYDPNKFPFGKQFILNTVDSYKRTFEQNAQYSLSAVINDPALLNNYQNNFNTGGWNGFLINTQYPQNNYLGFQMLATEQLARKLQGTTQNAAQKVQTTLSQGMGFLSPKVCPTTINPAYNNGTNEFLRPQWDDAAYEASHPYEPGDSQASLRWSEAKDAAKAAWNKANTCLKADGTSGLVATTPGSVVGNQIMTAVSSSFRKTELGAAVGGSISAILDTLLNKFFDKVTGGLTGSSLNTDNTSSSTDTRPGTCSVGGTDSTPMPSLKTKNDCISLGGTWTLTTSIITPPPIGTCTLADGGASKTTKTDCDAVEGIWDPTPTTPPVIGACTTDGGTTNTTQNSCDLVGGIWDPTPLPPPPVESGTCNSSSGIPLPSITTEIECDNASGIWTANPPVTTEPISIPAPTPVGSPTSLY